MQESFRKFYNELFRKDLDDSQIHQLVKQILGNLTDDDPAWTTHVKQAMSNKGFTPNDVERVLSELKSEIMDRSQRYGEKSRRK